MRVLHLIRRIGALNRGNIITPRQIESACSARLAHTGHNRHSNDMTKPDLALSQIAARFTRHDVEWSRGAFMIIDRRTANPIARLRPIQETDRFELFYWSNVKGRWTTFGNLGRMTGGRALLGAAGRASVRERQCNCVTLNPPQAGAGRSRR
jgi:hypothetical protein